MDSLNQAFLMFDQEGKCFYIYSKSCERMFETDVGGKKFVEVLKLKGQKKNDFNDWVSLIFSDRFDFETINDLGPKSYDHSKKLFINLQYKLYRGVNHEKLGVVVIGTDSTKEDEAKAKLEEKSTYVNRILNI